jgi:hypothetical protein
MSFDALLVAEMPVMRREKLESDGRTFGWLIALVVLFLVASADYYGQPLLATTFAMDAISVRLIGHLLVFLAFINLLILPSTLQRLTLRREVAFRRQHGKWRWER